MLFLVEIIGMSPAMTLNATMNWSGWERPMLGVTVLLCILTGATLAWAATKVPAHMVALERCGGALIVLSLALLGGSLPLLR